MRKHSYLIDYQDPNIHLKESALNFISRKEKTNSWLLKFTEICNQCLKFENFNAIHSSDQVEILFDSSSYTDEIKHKLEFIYNNKHLIDIQAAQAFRSRFPFYSMWVIGCVDGHLNVSLDVEFIKILAETIEDSCQN